MSTVHIDPLVAACLLHLDKNLGPGPWAGSSPEHDEFLFRFGEMRDVLNSLPSETIEAIGSDSAEVVNTFLRERGYDVSLQEAPPPSLYVAAVLDILALWAEPGEPSFVYVQSTRQRRPGVKLMRGQYALCGKVLRAEVQGPVAVYMVESENLDGGLAEIRSVLGREFTPGECKQARFPMVDLSTDVDINWAAGLRKGDAVVTEAVAHARLRLDPKGAHAQAAAAAAVTRGMAREFTISEAFTIAFVTEAGIAIAYHVTVDDFRQPGEPVGSEAKAPSSPRRYVETW